MSQLTSRYKMSWLMLLIYGQTWRPRVDETNSLLTVTAKQTRKISIARHINQFANKDINMKKVNTFDNIPVDLLDAEWKYLFSYLLIEEITTLHWKWLFMLLFTLGSLETESYFFLQLNPRACQRALFPFFIYDAEKLVLETLTFSSGRLDKIKSR